MQNDRTTGRASMPDANLGPRVRALLQDRCVELAAMAHRPEREFKILEVWPIMAALGAQDRACYVLLRQTLSVMLRGHALRLRSLKILLRETARLMPEAQTGAIRAEVSRSRSIFNALITLRRMGRVWSKAVRSGVIASCPNESADGAATILRQLSDAVREERKLRRASRAAWDSGRDDQRLEQLHQQAIDRLDALLKISDELKEN